MMCTRWKLALIALAAPLAVARMYAQAPSDNAAAGVGAMVCGGCGMFVIAWIVLSIALLIWVARDAKARGMDSAILWMLLVFFLGLIGLVIYLFSRTKGELVLCSNCNNKRLQSSLKCPHCGHGV